MNLFKISGPPGTGKTTRLLTIVEEFLAQGVQPEDIAFTTFTKAGAEEAKNRACDRFKLSPSRLPWFRTLHSIAYQSIPRTSGVMGNSDWCSIASLIGVPFTLKFTEGDGIPSSATKGDAMLMLYNMERVTHENETVIWNKRDHWTAAFPNLFLAEYQHFKKVINEYKQHSGKIDYTDMLVGFLDQGTPTPDVSHVIVDEAQDLSRLQWQVVAKLWSRADKVIVAGDDDQAIHEWNGADPHTFINLQCEQNAVLHQSYRVPSRIHQLATRISSRITTRIDKPYQPRSHAGEIVWTSSLDRVPLKEPSSWLLLARNQYHLAFLEAACLRAGVPFISPRSDKRLIAAKQAALSWIRLTRGDGTITHPDAIQMYSFMSQRDRVARGAKTKLTEAKESVLTWNYLTAKYGLVATPQIGWETALDMIPGIHLAYLRAALNPDNATAKIEISTIHGAKGREADNVVLMLDMTQRTVESFHRNPDAEHRVWYVGVTRSKSRLFLINSESANAYPMPS